MSETIDQHVLEKYKEAFIMFDYQGTGTVKTEDVGILVRGLGKNPTETELDEFITRLCGSNATLVDFEQFCKIMQQTMRGIDSEEEVMEAFSIFDHDGSGTITVDELRKSMTSLGEVLSMEELSRMLKFAPVKNGRVEYRELTKKLLENPLFRLDQVYDA